MRWPPPLGKSGCAAAGSGKQLLALATKIVSRGLPGADKIAHSFVGGVRCPHAQVSSPARMQPRQRNRISPVRFDPLARPFRDQSRRDHHAFVAERLDLPIKPVSRRPGFKTNMQPIVSAGQSLDQFARIGNGLFSTSPRNRTSPRPPPSAIRDCVLSSWRRRKPRRLRYTSLMVRPPCMRLGSACPSNHSFLSALKGGPPAPAREPDV